MVALELLIIICSEFYIAELYIKYINILTYATLTIMWMGCDALKKRDRKLLVGTGLLVFATNAYAVLTRILTDKEEGLVLVSVMGNDLMLRNFKRSLFLNITVLLAGGLVHMISDQRCERCMYVLVHPKKKHSITDEDQQSTAHTRRQILLGEKILLCAAVLYLFVFARGVMKKKQPLAAWEITLGVVSCVTAIGGLVLLFRRNVSTVGLRASVLQVEVINVMCFLVLHMIVNVMIAEFFRNYLNTFTYIISVLCFITFNNLHYIKRSYFLGLSILFALNNVYNIFSRVILSTDEGIVLGEILGHPIYARSVKRSIYLNIFLLTLDKIIILVKDKKMKVNLFKTASCYQMTLDIRPHHARENVRVLQPRQRKKSLAAETAIAIAHPGNVIDQI